MKTQTILLSYLRTRDMRFGVRVRNSRQYDTFENALLDRIERCDRAREALKEVEWIFDDRSGIICPWCHGRKHYLGHSPDCPRQIALGVEK